MSDFAIIAARLATHDDDLAALAARLARVEALLGPWLADQAAALDPRTHPQTREDAHGAPRRAGDGPTATHDPEAARTACRGAEAVKTGHPVTQLLACKLCGVLLWDIDAHYNHAHPMAARYWQNLGGDR